MSEPCQVCAEFEKQILDLLHDQRINGSINNEMRGVIGELEAKIKDLKFQNDEYKYWLVNSDSTKNNIIKQLQKENKQLTKDINLINQAFRKVGWGQGEIDSYAVEVDKLENQPKYDIGMDKAIE